MVAKFIHGHKYRSWDVAGLVLIACSNIDDNRAGVLGGFDLMPLDVRSLALTNVVSNISGLVDRILGRAESRGVRKLEVHQVIDGQPCIDCSCNHINTLVHAIAANSLSAQQLAGLWVKEDLEAHSFRARVVAGMA